MADIKIFKINEVWMKVECSEIYMEMDIQDKFQFETKTLNFNPKYKKWDGVIKLYNRKTKLMYLGLLPKLLKLCSKQEFSVELDESFDDGLLDDLNQYSKEDVIDIVKSMNPQNEQGKPLEPYDYQTNAIQHMLNKKRSTCLIATSGGKSLIIASMVRIYQAMDDLKDKKIVVVVPTISLVEQMYNDMKVYFDHKDSNWRIGQHVQRLSNKYSKHIDRQVIISTYQSFVKLPDFIKKDVGAIICDEAHTCKSQTFINILTSLPNASYRHGMTGTLDDVELNELTIQGLLGSKKKFVTAKELIDSGKATKVNIEITILSHRKKFKEKVEKFKKSLDKPIDKYNFEIECINNNQKRNEKILEMINIKKGNSLILFDKVENYGIPLYESFKKLYPDRKAFLNVGKTDIQEREDIKKSMENEDNAIIFASYGTFSTGISIKKLNNLFIVSGTKSKIRILQSIGRMMRLHESKENVTIYDIVDDMNSTLSQAESRIKYYNKEKFPYKFKKIKL